MSPLAKFTLAAIALLFVPPALADDWVAVKLRGTVVQLVDNNWQPLRRNEVVPDSRVVRTVGNGYVEFTRGGEVIELQPNTQIQIYDKGTSKPDTTVKQYFGTVGIEAQVQDVQHFAVDTPFLAAVVKGTRFVVTSGKTGASVKVNRGRVSVENKHNKNHVLIGVGQSATVGAGPDGGDGGIVVQGSGKLPAVVNSKGQPVQTTSSSGSSSTVSVGVGDTDLVSVGVGGDSVASLRVGGSDDTGGLVRVGVGGSKGLVSVGVGGNSGSGGGLLSVGIGQGSGNSGSGSGSSGGSGSGSSGSGSSGSGGSGSSSGSSGSSGGSGGSNSGSHGSGSNSGNSDSGGGGKLVNVSIGGIHIGL
jgi:hypothetical protein